MVKASIELYYKIKYEEYINDIFKRIEKPCVGDSKSYSNRQGNRQINCQEEWSDVPNCSPIWFRKTSAFWPSKMFSGLNDQTVNCLNVFFFMLRTLMLSIKNLFEIIQVSLDCFIIYILCFILWILHHDSFFQIIFSFDLRTFFNFRSFLLRNFRNLIFDSNIS